MFFTIKGNNARISDFINNEENNKQVLKNKGSVNIRTGEVKVNKNFAFSEDEKNEINNWRKGLDKTLILEAGLDLIKLPMKIDQIADLIDKGKIKYNDKDLKAIDVSLTYLKRTIKNQKDKK